MEGTILCIPGKASSVPNALTLGGLVLVAMDSIVGAVSMHVVSSGSQCDSPDPCPEHPYRTTDQRPEAARAREVPQIPVSGTVVVDRTTIMTQLSELTEHVKLVGAVSTRVSTLPPCVNGV